MLVDHISHSMHHLIVLRLKLLFKKNVNTYLYTFDLTSGQNISSVHAKLNYKISFKPSLKINITVPCVSYSAVKFNIIITLITRFSSILA